MRATYHQEGSFLRGDLTSGPEQIAVELDVSSNAPIDAVRAVIQIAHRSCFVENALRGPAPISTTDRINGAPLV